MIYINIGLATPAKAIRTKLVDWLVPTEDQEVPWPLLAMKDERN